MSDHDDETLLEQQAALRWSRSYGALEALDPAQTFSPAEGQPADGGARPGSLPGYTMGQAVGIGGMGVVYRATQEVLGREVAVKLAPSPDLATRFTQEARLAARLDHPNVVPVHDLVRAAEGEALVMKLVEGRRWGDDLRGRSADEVSDASILARHLEVLLTLCNALAYAHSRGVAHCDVKPDNVMLGAYGEVYLVDWGLAREIGMPSDGVPCGTPRYMAPEQARGDAPGAATDVFLLGATLFEVLCGRPPYAQQRLSDVVGAAVRAVPPVLGASVSTELAHICRTAMAPRPEDRFPHVSAFRGALHRALEHRESARVEALALEALERAQTLEGQAAYVRFGEAVASFTQALLSWPESETAREGRERSLRLFAEAALDKGDLTLAESQARRLDEASVVRHALLHRIEEARRVVDSAARASRIQRRSLVVAVFVILVGLIVGVLLLDSEKRRTEAQAEVARARLADVQRLADVRRLDDLEARSQTLWPAAPATVAALEAWVREAREVGARLSGHRAWLVRLEHEQGRQQGERWTFDDARAQWEHDALARMLSAGDQLMRTELPRVEERLSKARALEAESVQAHADDWKRAVDAVARDVRYAGLRLRPQLGLVPLGPDPVTRLQEFAHLSSGEAPRREKDGRLVRTEASGVVLVLVPGGTFLMGASRTPGGPGFDAQAKPSEGPVHPVRLAPFMISKYEMTQAQWLRAADHNPASFPVGRTVGGRVIRGLNPVEHVSWDEAVEMLRRLDLTLPTEAQWEYAARGGTSTPWSTGAARESLRGHANLADRWCRDHDGPESWRYEAWLDDGHTVHAPTGSFAANGFGLHDMAGNVWEWVRDGLADYRTPVRGDDAERPAPRDARHVFRGGGFRSTAGHARPAERYALYFGDNAAFDVGVRPLWKLR